MNIKRFDFIDENFGEKVECVHLWDNESSIIIAVFGNSITIKEHKNGKELFKDMITTEHELEIHKNIVCEQDMEIAELKNEIELLKSKVKKENKNERGIK